MTNKDLLIQLLSEATGESKVRVTLKLDFVIRQMEEEKAGVTSGFYKALSSTLYKLNSGLLLYEFSRGGVFEHRYFI